MKQSLSFLFALLFVSSVFAQKFDQYQATQNYYDQTYAQLYYWNYQLSDALDTASIAQIIKREFQLGENDELRVAAIKTSLTATHITFKQYYQGIEVYGGGAKVAVSRNNVLFRCFETLFSTAGNIPDALTSFSPLDKLSNFRVTDVLASKPMYVFTGDILRSAWYCHFLHDETGDMEKLWLANGTEFYSRDLNRYATGPDSTVSAKVFHPDPITPINKVYGGTYIDLNDGNTNTLDPERKTVEMSVTFDAGTFKLKSDYVEIVEHSSPVLPVVTSTTPDFSFSRSDDGFEQTNAYFHIMNYQYYLQSLEFSDLDDFIHVDAQGFNGQDNSAFTPSTNPPRLTFGEGGVDDAEDADVIVHEYGHHISNQAAPFTNNGIERRCLDEAFGDYVAVSYTRDQFSFGNNLVFNWDGHNPFWIGRTVDNPDNLCYDNVSFTNIYTNTTLFNAAMFDIWDQLGKQYTDKLMIEALHGYYQNMSFRDAAMLILDADSALSSSAHDWMIWQAFDNYCILDWSDITKRGELQKKPYVLKNSMLSANETFQVELTNGIEKGELIVYDITVILFLKVRVVAFRNHFFTLLIYDVIRCFMQQFPETIKVFFVEVNFVLFVIAVAIVVFVLFAFCNRQVEVICFGCTYIKEIRSASGS
jgi:Zn-dependent metalloprotease